MNKVLCFFLLCMQGYLLTHALDCADGGMDCDSGQIERKKTRYINTDDERGAHRTQANLPGAFKTKGFPNTLIQADRSRRHLNSNKKRQLPPRSRVGSHSLLSHNPMSPLPVMRARRHARTADTVMLSRMQVPRRRVTRKNTRVTGRNVCRGKSPKQSKGK
ncbi:hypothetical protein Q7C36_023300 [Tachysurus vachellii]|uniref:Secreted protein n=2 Tax=Tachysurus vachellii TaxID=175792 RepID=A0AA88IKZ4_TACVA|nr:hypothetical protein Q7C36_023300 [Tachysurus vachellii]